MLEAWRQTKLPLHFAGCDGWVRVGTVTSVNADLIRLKIRGVTRGMLTVVETGRRSSVFAQVTCVEDGEAVCETIEPTRDIAAGDRAIAIGARLGSFCGYGLLGRRVDAWGGPAHPDSVVVPGDDVPLEVDERRTITKPLHTRVAAIDGLCTIGVGQRVALFSGSGVGKSTLLRFIAEHASLDTHVVALIGERGREAAEAEQELTQTRRWKTTSFICATAEAPASHRLAALRTAIAQAQWLCERGHDVLLTVDSLTRVAYAWREIALAAGERPAHRGYPPTLPGMLARIVERAGVRDRGSITALFAVLVDADDLSEPVTDIVRGLLDGHIVLSRALANSGRYPPIDVLRSSSRVMNQIVSRKQLADAARVRKAIAALERAEDLFAIGAYVPGGDPVLDAAVAQRDRIERFVFHEREPKAGSVEELSSIAAALHP